MFGITGVILGVPIMAVAYSIIKEIIEKRLRSRGKPVDISEYLCTRTDTKFIIVKINPEIQCA